MPQCSVKCSAGLDEDENPGLPERASEEEICTWDRGKEKPKNAKEIETAQQTIHLPFLSSLSIPFP
jgi:hypothetical protein